MKEELISIVVPIYKVENFLSTCIESILRQSYSNFELILVDDGSPDLCPSICEKYKKFDSRIKVIHKKNGGLSDARNAGLRIAKGKWITFIDSDDYIGINFLKELYRAAIDNEADISICDYSTVLNNNGQEKRSSFELGLNNIECLEHLYNPKMHGMEFVAWGKLYHMSLFTIFKIEYPVGKIHEDIFTTYKLIYLSQNIVFVDYIGYFYRIRKDSIMTSSFNLSRLAILDAREEACDFFLKNHEITTFNLALNAFLREFVILYSELSECKTNFDFRKEKKQLMKKYNSALKKYLNISNLDQKHKIFYNAFAIYPSKIYRKILR